MIRQRASAIRLSIFFKDIVDAAGKPVLKQCAPVYAYLAHLAVLRDGNRVAAIREFLLCCFGLLKI